MIKYKAEMYYTPTIKKIEVERETVCFVWVNGRRESKDCESCQVFNTFIAAQHNVMSKIQRKIDYHKKEITVLEQQRQNLEELTEEDC